MKNCIWKMILCKLLCLIHCDFVTKYFNKYGISNVLDCKEGDFLWNHDDDEAKTNLLEYDCDQHDNTITNKDYKLFLSFFASDEIVL